MSDSKNAKQFEDIGYDVICKLLAEGPNGKTQSAWKQDIASRLAAYKADAPSRKAVKDAEKIEHAFELASELIDELSKAARQ